MELASASVQIMNSESNRDVLLISPSLNRGKGGVENLMWRIRERSRHRFTVLTEDPPLESRDHSMKVTRLEGAVQVTRFFLSHRHRFDVVYVSTAQIAHLLLAPWLLGTTTLIHAHGRDIFFDPSSLKTRVRALLSRFLIGEASRIFAVSEWTKEQILEAWGGAIEENVVGIPNGVDADRFQGGNGASIRDKYGITEEEFLLCTVARLDPRKGHRFVLEALPDLPNCTYLIVGAGSHGDRLRDMIAEKGLSDRVVMTGFIPDEQLPDVYDACDLFVMPSEHLEDSNNVEGFGISFLEANAAGKAVVGTWTGGIPTAVKHEETGILCEPDSRAVGEAIKLLQEDASLRRRLEQNAFRWAQDHDWSRIIDRVDDAIESAIASSRH